MSILYDEGQEAIAAEAGRILAAESAKERLLPLLEAKGEVDETFWKLAREQGWTGIAFPEAHGGLGLGLVELGIVALECGAHTVGAPFLTTSYGAGAAMLAAAESGPAGEWLQRLASGEAIGAVAFGEGTSALPRHPQVRVEGGRLIGTKPAVTAGGRADVAVVWASEGGEPVLAVAALGGTARALVDSFDNSRLAADIAFDGTPATVIARGTDARALALETLARMAVVVAHEQAGGARSLLYTARDYANTRRAFGQLIGAFQSVKHRIAELYGLYELARANAIHAASRAGEADFVQAAAAARLMATEAYDTAARDCIQVHGGIGVTWEGGLHLHMRRARSLAIETGNMFWWEDQLAEELTGVAA